MIAACFALLAMAGCKKSAIEQEPLSSITIANVIVGGMQAKLKGYIAAVQNINNNAGMTFTLPAGNNQLFVWPVTDSTKPYYNAPLTTANQEIYSLFLTGTPDAVESLVIKENLPVQNDSSFGVRFINLAPGSPAVKLTLSTTPTVSEFGNVEYKAVSAWKNYPATYTQPIYTFQVRHAATDVVIASLTLTGTSASTGIPRFSNVTLVLRGKVGGTPAAGITKVNHFFKL
jgi:uncharacterized protein DUF4397